MTATEGYLAETADIGTTVRISPDAKAESLQILVNDEDLVGFFERRDDKSPFRSQEWLLPPTNTF